MATQEQVRQFINNLPEEQKSKFVERYKGLSTEDKRKVLTNVSVRIDSMESSDKEKQVSVMNRISERPTIAQGFEDIGKNFLDSVENIRQEPNPLKRFLMLQGAQQGAMGRAGLEAISAPMRSAVSAVSAPIVSAIEGSPEFNFEAFKGVNKFIPGVAAAKFALQNQDALARAALSGQAQMGDILRAANVPEPVAATGGFMGEVALGGATGKGAGLAKQASSAIRKQISKAVSEGVTKGIRRSVTGKKTAPLLKSAKKKAEEAILDIVENKDTLQFTDDLGNVTKGLPESLDDTLQAVSQRKRQVWQAVEEAQDQVGATGKTIGTNDIQEELLDLFSKRSRNVSKPEIRGFIENQIDELDKIGNMTIKEVQENVTSLNDELTAFYKNPNPQEASVAPIKALIKNRLNKKLDDAVKETLGKDRPGLTKKYSALKSIEDDLARRVIVSARQSKVPLIDYPDIFSAGDILGGAISGNPFFILKGVTQAALKNYLKKINNPNNQIKKMFKEVDALINKGVDKSSQVGSGLTAAGVGLRETGE